MAESGQCFLSLLHSLYKCRHVLWAGEHAMSKGGDARFLATNLLMEISILITASFAPPDFW